MKRLPLNKKHEGLRPEICDGNRIEERKNQEMLTEREKSQSWERERESGEKEIFIDGGKPRVKFTKPGPRRRL